MFQQPFRKMTSSSKFNNSNNTGNNSNNNGNSYYEKSRDPRHQSEYYKQIVKEYYPHLEDENEWPPLNQQQQPQQQQQSNDVEVMEIEQPPEEQKQGKTLYLNPKNLFNITRARQGFINIKTCQKCRDEMFHNKNRFQISDDEEHVTCSIKLCKSCAINNVISSIKYWTMPMQLWTTPETTTWEAAPKKQGSTWNQGTWNAGKWMKSSK
jgi:hypothetical protein